MSKFAFRLVISALMLSYSLGILAQEPVDSVTIQELDEVIVEAANQVTTSTSSSYIPKNIIKKASNNAIDLLSRMQVPEIQVDQYNGTVKDLAGRKVTIFIDGRKAGIEEIKGMRMADVMRVEYLSNPSDSKFMHETSVINFVMRKYEYGGYTKLYETFNWLPYTSWNVDNLFVYSRMAYKKTIWNIWTGASTWNSNHFSPESYETFKLGDDAQAQEIERIQRPLEDRKYDLSAYGGLEHLYNNQNIQISQSLDFQYSYVPLETTKGIILFKPDISGFVTSGDFYKKSPSQKLIPRYTGNYYFSLGKGWAVNTAVQFTYSHDKQWSLYESADPATIVNNVFTDRYSLVFSQDWSKRLDSHNSLSILASGNLIWQKLSYTGNNPMRLKQSDNNYAISGFYQLHLDDFYLTFTGGVNLFHTKSGTTSQNDVAPNLSLFSRYAFDRKNSLQLNAGYYLQNRTFSFMSEHLTQSNELLYYVGNPDLKRSKNMFVNLQYVWMPNNSINGAFYVNYTSGFNKIVPIYSLLEGRNAIIEHYANSGNVNRINTGINMTWRLLNGRFALQINPEIGYERIAGVYDAHRTGFQVKTSIYYYIGDFNFCALYESPTRFLHEMGAKIDISDVYDFQAGWSHDKWNVSISLRNPLRRSWKESTYKFHSPLYSYVKHNNGAFPHSRLSLQVCYTFGYGKKIQQGNERGPQIAG